ncbi:hypothetical protein MJG53_017455 [Ovis ammon polii x Ovis aries]|uniref:Uncharacterized protein n=1 Tax=Ovis ammon polii x Ovis aries TaxID=2918886 RepID=A0ACB9U7X2_9CETA|nr:hypothetical protein MJG53_017455 [Ovis ammon polii x Ovis aries]
MKADEERQPREDRPLAQRAEQLCGQHLEKLHYYCKDDQRILCVTLSGVPGAQAPRCCSAGEGCAALSGKILNHLKILKGDRDRIQNFQSTGEDEIQALLAKFQSHKQGRAAVFAQGHQFLRERGQCLLEWLEGTERQLTGGRNSHLAKGSAEVIRLETLISELEKKARQPALELLQDPSDITSRYPQKKFWIEKPVSPAIRKRMEEFSDKCLCLEKGLRGFHGKLMRDLEYKTMRSILNSRPANGYLAVSPDGKSMVFTGLWLNKCQRGQQFDLEPGVLGSKGFTWGRVYWEVKVDRIWWEAEEEEETMRYRVGSRGVFGSNNLGGFTGITDGYHSPGYREENEELEEERSQENRIWPKFCLVGVARESVVRRGFLNFTPEEGSGLCSCPQLGCLYAAARGPSRSCPTAPGRLELLWIMMVGR